MKNVVARATIPVVLTAVTGCIFLLDLRFEHEFATWLPYFILAVPVAKLYSPRILFASTAAWTLLIAAKLLVVSPADRLEIALFNRSVGLVTLWAITFLLHRHRSLGQRASEEGLRVTAIVDGALDAVITIDAQSRITAWNPQAEKIFGFRRDEALGTPLPELIIPQAFREAHAKGLQHFLETGEGPILSRRIEVMALHKNGREFPVELTVMPLRTGATFSFCAFVRDITERKDLEATLRQARAAAETASQDKSDFLANVSHEIRTPLNAICGTTDLLLSTTLTPPQRRYAEMCAKASQNLLRLVTDLLDFSRIEAGRIQLEQQPYDVRQIVERTVSLMVHRAEEKGLTLTHHIAPEIPTLLVGDGFRLHQVLLNLLVNALKFTDQGYVTVRATRELSGQEGPRIRIGVVDSGIGIPPDQLERIFDRFTQVDGAASRQHGGVGLGLAICKRLVDLMGGRIWAESSPGSGSTFIVEFPLNIAMPTEHVPNHEVTGALPWAPLPASSQEGLRILLAEDSAESQELMQCYFQNTPHQVEAVGDGEAAVARFASGRFDLVLMDLQMPGMDGFTATRMIRAWETRHDRPPVPILALTANAFREAEDQCSAAGCTGFLTKPISRPILLATLARYQPGKAPTESGQAAGRGPGTLEERIEEEIRQRRPQFLDNRRKDLIALQQAMATQDYTTIGMIGHRIKGLAGSYGFPDIGAAGQALEAAGKNRDSEAVHVQLDRLATLLNQIDQAA